MLKLFLEFEVELLTLSEASPKGPLLREDGISVTFFLLFKAELTFLPS